MALTPNRLKKLVTYRERLEKLQERELALTAQRQAERQRAVDAALDARGQFLDEPAALGPLDPVLRAAGGAYLGRVDREIEARYAALAHSRVEVAGERAKLLDRRRDRKAMEALLDAARAQLRHEHQRAEMAALDEQAGSRWLRNDHGPDP
ncbi:MAG: flagellar export protein FliJ [Dehalococcoidia bacterium]